MSNKTLPLIKSDDFHPNIEERRPTFQTVPQSDKKRGIYLSRCGGKNLSVFGNFL
jgi:hypothetical protein